MNGLKKAVKRQAVLSKFTYNLRPRKKIVCFL